MGNEPFPAGTRLGSLSRPNNDFKMTVGLSATFSVNNAVVNRRVRKRGEKQMPCVRDPHPIRHLRLNTSSTNSTTSLGNKKERYKIYNHGSRKTRRNVSRALKGERCSHVEHCCIQGRFENLWFFSLAFSTDFDISLTVLFRFAY